MISIVIPTYNEEAYIDRVLSSIKDQTIAAGEVIVADESSDRTPAIAHSYGAKVVSSTTRGVSAARKRGCETAQGELIVCTDADSHLPPNYLETVEQHFRSDPELVGIFGPVHFYDGPAWIRWLSHGPFSLFLRFSSLIGTPNANGMNFAFRKIAYKEAGGFDPKTVTAEDIELAQRLKVIGRVDYTPDLVVETSARRIMGMGPARFFLHHTRNYLRMITKRPALVDFKPYR